MLGLKSYMNINHIHYKMSPFYKHHQPGMNNQSHKKENKLKIILHKNVENVKL